MRSRIFQPLKPESRTLGTQSARMKRQFKNLGGGDTRIKRSDLALAGSPIIDLKSFMKIEFTTNECDITQFRSLNDASKVGSTEDKTAL